MVHNQIMSEIKRSATYHLLKKTTGLPAGLWLFSRMVCFKAPYFSSIRPRFLELEPGRAKAMLRKRRRVTNHLSTVHAIAMANLCEYVAGTLMEVSIPRDMRWIPKGMNIRYLGLAKTDVYAQCSIDDYNWREKQDVILNVTVHDTSGTQVAEADVPMYVSPKPSA